MPRFALTPRRVLSLVLGAGLVSAWLTANLAAASATVPVPVITSLSGGYSRTCALTGPGDVKCWGDARASTGSFLPVDIPGLTSGVTAISVRGPSCALTAASGVKCWSGLNETPVDVAGLTSGVRAISTGGDHACVLMSNGRVRCWGDNTYGQLGDGTTTDSQVPVKVVGLTEVSAISAAGYGHTCALTTAGGVKCWGDNYFGDLGNGTTTNSLTPVYVSGLQSGVAAISASPYRTTCALLISGGLKCWGWNLWGQLGDGTAHGLDSCGYAGGTPCSRTPVDVIGLTSGVAAVSVGYRHACALTTAGGVKCWGYNQRGELGNGTQGSNGDSCVCIPTPADVVGLTSGASAIAAGWYHTCVVTADGGGSCWGENTDGQLGDGTTIDRPSPVALFAPMISGINSSLAKIDASGSVFVTTAWTGIDPYARITSYQAQMRVGSGPWTDVSLAHPLSTHFTAVMNRNKARYAIQVRAVDSAGHVGAWSPEIPFVPNTAQESSASFSTGWDHRVQPGFWGGAAERAHRSGPVAIFTFRGYRLDWIGSVAPTYGSADVYMDGVYVTTIDCHATAPAHRRILFQDDQIGYGAHTVEIFARGRVDVDGFFWLSP